MRPSLRVVWQVLVTAAAYYAATRIGWSLTLPNSRVALLFPPYALLVAALLLVPTRHWWAYTIAAMAAHFVATQQAGWPMAYALGAESFDVTRALLAAGGIRMVVKSPFHRPTFSDALSFVLIAVVGVPMVTSLWGAAFTLPNSTGPGLFIQWRNLTLSSAVTAIVLIPALLNAAHQVSTRRVRMKKARVLEAILLGVTITLVSWLVFAFPRSGNGASPQLYAPVPLLVWVAVRFGVGGVSSSMLVVAAFALWGAINGHGPFVTRTPPQNVLGLELYLLMMATSLTLLTVAIEVERRTKEALRVSEERMSLVLDSAQLAVWDWDVTTDRLWISDEGRRLFGFGPGETLHYADLARRVHPDDDAARAAAIQGALASGSPYENEYRIILPDGSIRWISARGQRVTMQDEERTRILGVSMDSTRKKETAQESLRQREQIAHLSRVATVSALSGSLAHELSQPLSSILSNAQAGQLAASRVTPDIGEIRAIFADIVNEGFRAGEIMKGLRTMLRRGQVVLEPVDVEAILENLLRLMAADLIGRGVSVSKLMAARIPSARADSVQLQQILVNLIVNACDAMASNRPGDRTLTITTATAQGEVLMGVLDCGVGLPEDVESLFQPFNSTKETGLGIGLSICRTLVTSHGGRLWAERRAERGAAFYVALPVAEDRDTGAHAARKLASDWIEKDTRAPGVGTIR